MKKLLSVVLSAVLAFGAISALAGCAKTKYDPNNFLATGTAENPYQIVKEKITLKIFVPTSPSNPPFASMKMFKRLSELTNINFEFDEADTSAYTQRRSTAWEDKKNLPDFFLFNNSVAEQVIYSKFGALTSFNNDSLSVNGLEVGNLIDNYMPTYKALLDNNFNINNGQDAKAIATLEDGNMYSTLCVSDVPRDLTFKMFINQKWIENLRAKGVKMRNGSAIPDGVDIKTVEQYVEILELFIKEDANNNDRKDEVPVSSKEMQFLRNFLLASYGYVFNSVEVENDKSQVVFTPATDAYKEYLKTVNYMYNYDPVNSLMDKSTFSIKTDAQLKIKGLEGRLGSFVAAAAYLVAGNEMDDDYVAFGPLTSNYYKGEPLQWGFSNFIASGAVIPTGTPYVREIARLLDILYSDLGCQLIAYGEDGVDFTWDDDAKTSWTFKVPADWNDTQEAYRATITPNVGTGSALYWKYDFVGRMNDKVITKLNTMSERYVPYLKQPIPETVRLTEEGYNEVEYIKASLDVYIASTENEFITGKIDNIDKNWASYLASLNKYNSNKLVSIYNDAYQKTK